jgi:hypothetical protein
MAAGVNGSAVERGRPCDPLGSLRTAEGGKSSVKVFGLLAMSLFLFYGAYRYVIQTDLVRRTFPEHVVCKGPVCAQRGNSLRETINNRFDQVRALADGVLFEFGPSRQQDLALRTRILRWQPQLRMLFLTRIALWRYRLQLPGFELPKPVALAARVRRRSRQTAGWYG